MASGEGAEWARGGGGGDHRSRDGGGAGASIPTPTAPARRGDECPTEGPPAPGVGGKEQQEGDD